MRKASKWTTPGPHTQHPKTLNVRKHSKSAQPVHAREPVRPHNSVETPVTIRAAALVASELAKANGGKVPRGSVASVIDAIAQQHEARHRVKPASKRND
jgi:hypothetical protein